MRRTRTAAASAVGTILLFSAGGLLAVPASAEPLMSSATVEDVTVEANFSDDTVEPGDELSLTIDFHNSGGATGAFYLVDGIDLFLDFESCTMPPGSDGVCELSTDGSAFRAEFDTLSPGTSTATAEFTVDEDAFYGVYLLPQALVVGSVLTTNFDPDASITVEYLEADLEAGLTATAPGLSGRIDYTATASNGGFADSENAQIVTTLPAATASVSNLSGGCTYAPVSDTVTCDVGTLADSATASVNFSANLGLLALGPQNATATVSSETLDPDAGNDTASATCNVVTSLLINCP